MLHIDWRQLLLPGPSWAEKLIRPVCVYFILLAIFRFASKRELAQATLFDFLIILLISNVVQNAMIGEDNSILGAAAGAVMLVFLSGRLNRVTASSRRARILLEGKAALLVKDGVINEAAMKRETVSHYDLFSSIRKQGISRLGDVAFAILELDGSISVIRKEDDHRPHDCVPPEFRRHNGHDLEHWDPHPVA